MRKRCWQSLEARNPELRNFQAFKCSLRLCLRILSFCASSFDGLCDLNLKFDMFQNNALKDKMSAVLARTWNYLSGLGQEPGWAVSGTSTTGSSCRKKSEAVSIKVPSESSRHSLPPGLAAWLQQVFLKDV